MHVYRRYLRPVHLQTSKLLMTTQRPRLNLPLPSVPEITTGRRGSIALEIAIKCADSGLPHDSMNRNSVINALLNLPVIWPTLLAKVVRSRGVQPLTDLAIRVAAVVPAVGWDIIGPDRLGVVGIGILHPSVQGKIKFSGVRIPPAPAAAKSMLAG